MRRDTFLKSLVALAAAGALPLTAQAAGNIKMMIPANPGGGWDATGRALGKAIIKIPSITKVQTIRLHSRKWERGIGSDNMGVFWQ